MFLELRCARGSLTSTRGCETRCPCLILSRILPGPAQCPAEIDLTARLTFTEHCSSWTQSTTTNRAPAHPPSAASDTSKWLLTSSLRLELTMRTVPTPPSDPRRPIARFTPSLAALPATRYPHSPPLDPRSSSRLDRPRRLIQATIPSTRMTKS